MRSRLRTGIVVVITLLVATGSSALATRGARETHHTIKAIAASCPVARQCNVDPDTDCPTLGPMSATPPDQCVALPTSLQQVDTTVGTPPNTRCAANFFVQVKLQPGLVSYEAVWYSTFGLGTRWWSSPGTVWPGRILGIGAYYSVPKGYAAWSASYSNCGAPPAGTYGTAGWGVAGCEFAFEGTGGSGSSITTRQPADASTTPTQQQQQTQQILSDIQDQLFPITNDVTCNKAKTQDKAYKKWDSYIRDPAIRTKAKVRVTPSSPLTVNVTITAPNAVIVASAPAAKRITVAKAHVKITAAGSITLKIPFTKPGLALMRRWLKADHRYLAGHAAGQKPPVVRLTDLVSAA